MVELPRGMPQWIADHIKLYYEDPNCIIHVGADQYKAKARVAQGDERAAKWRALVEIYPPYEEYRKRAGDREIPVVVLEV